MKQRMVSVEYVISQLNRIYRGIENDRFTQDNIRALQVSLDPEPHPDAE